MSQIALCAAWITSLLGLPSSGTGQTPQIPPAESTSIELGKTGLSLQVPPNWTKQLPKSPMLEHEFSAGDPAVGDVRITAMAAGGSVKANLARWQQQFTPHHGQPVKNWASEPERTIAGKSVHLVDFRGTYLDRPRGPAGPAESKENYRMLGAVIELNGGSSYFFKLYGPAQAVEKQQAAFQEFLSSMKRR